ncbi:MAG: SDR family oxidoreductase [Tetrasphaera sp.]|nr:SDR family oxidoreductase [Tetrasphaera sp.]
MAGRLQDKVAVVTGGCSGIGLATVRRFAEEGAKVVLADLNDELGAQLAEELGGTYVHCNVASKEDVDNLFKVAHDTYGRALTSPSTTPASARPRTTPILDTDLEAWDKVQLVNLTSVYLSLQGGPPLHARAEVRLDQHRVLRRGHGCGHLADLLPASKGGGCCR